MIEQDCVDLLERITRFVSGETTKELVDDIEGIVLECFREEEWADQLIWVLSCFEPGGGEHYYDEREVATELAAVAPLLAAERGAQCD
ncbi:MAG: hypothetical protein WD023_05575 [Ilumatobacteraceae bacterium]